MLEDMYTESYTQIKSCSRHYRNSFKKIMPVLIGFKNTVFYLNIGFNFIEVKIATGTGG